MNKITLIALINKRIRKTILIITLFIFNTLFSQSKYQKENQARVKSNINETFVYKQFPNSNQKKLIRWEQYDKNGRVIESKYNINDGLRKHYKFEYPDNMTRVLISLNENGKEIERIHQSVELSIEKTPLKEFNESKTLRFEYDKNGNLIKQWRITKEQTTLQIEIFYDKNNLRIKEKAFIFNNKIITLYRRDANGNLIKKTTEYNGKDTYIEFYEHKS